MSEQDSTTPAEPAPQDDPGPLASRLQYLFGTKHRADGKRYSYREVIEAIQRELGTSISIGHLSKLVNGTATNPSLDVLQGLAWFFSVSISYFDLKQDVTETQQQLKLAQALRAAGVQDIAMHAVGLPPESIELVLAMIDRVRQVEGLPPAGQQPGTTT